MELEELIPERATWIKEIKGEGETRELELHFRPFSIEDESWLKQAFGDRLKEIFEKMEMQSISRIAFRQLEPECKRELMKLKFMDIDEDGEDIEIAKRGPEKLSKIIVGYPEQMELLKILLKTRGFSMPIIEELGEHIVNEVEKETSGKRKKARKKKSIGPRSLT